MRFTYWAVSMQLMMLGALLGGCGDPDNGPRDGAVVDGAIVDGAVVDGAVVDGAAAADASAVDGAVQADAAPPPACGTVGRICEGLHGTSGHPGSDVTCGPGEVCFSVGNFAEVGVCVPDALRCDVFGMPSGGINCENLPPDQQICLNDRDNNIGICITEPTQTCVCDNAAGPFHCETVMPACDFDPGLGPICSDSDLYPLDGSPAMGCTFGASNDLGSPAGLVETLYVLDVPGGLFSIEAMVWGGSFDVEVAILDDSCQVLAPGDLILPGLDPASYAFLADLVTDPHPAGTYLIKVVDWPDTYHTLFVEVFVWPGEPCDPAQVASGLAACTGGTQCVDQGNGFRCQ